MTLTTYASIGVSRIQAHLSRSRKLSGRRGASEELILLTRKPARTDAAEEGLLQTGSSESEPYLVEKILGSHPNVTLNDGAPDIDGEVALLGADEDEVLACAREYAETMQARLPALHISIRWVTTDNSYAHTLGLKRSDLKQEDYLPQLYEYPLVRLCGLCGIDAATVELPPRADDERLVLCPDCAQRTDRPGRWKTLNDRDKTKEEQESHAPSRFTAEYDLLMWARRHRPAPNLEAAKDFEDLARLTTPDAAGRTRTHRHHLALLFADGNGLGVLFDKLRTEAKRDDAKTFNKVSKAMKDATTGALQGATDAIMAETDTLLPVVPHIVGGDDVLISLPAERAWRFLEHFLVILRDALDSELSLLVDADLIPTMSAGLVICHHAYPFANQVELAEDLLKRAKRHVRGKTYSFTWLDVTAEGTSPLENRTPWTLQTLRDQRGALKLLNDPDFAASSEASIRRTLAVPDRADRHNRLALLAHRMPRIQTFLDAVKTIEGQSQEQIITDLVSLQRWFT